MSYQQSFWRDSSLNPRILGVDARAYFPLLCWLFYPRKWTFIAAVAAIAFFVLIEKKGYTLPVFLRFLRHKLRGNVIPARAWWYQRRFFE